jgi:ketosteroid isomerase-like protein
MEDSELRAFVQRWFGEIWAQGRLELLDEMLDDGYVRHSASGTAVIGKEQAKKDLAQYMRVLHRPVTTIDDQVVQGDRVWTRATSRGVNLETGEPSVASWLMVQQLREGRLVESWSATLYGVDWH